MENKKDRQIWLLDVLRGVSALLIVLFHYTSQYEISIGHVKTWPVRVSWGCYAIFAFFALSGFLTFYNLSEKQTASAFLKKRLIRLYPVFWAAVIVTSVYMAILMPERLRSFKDILLNLTMVPFLFGAEYVDGVYWTLARELIFYIIIAVLIKTKRTKNLCLIQIVWWIIVFCSAFYCMGPLKLPARGLVNVGANVEGAHAFLLGIAIYALYENKDLRTRAVSIGSIICSIVYCGIIKEPEATVCFASLAGVMGAIVYLHKKGYRCSDGLKKLLYPFAFLAGISYPLYLVHQFTGFAIIRKMEEAGMTSEIFVFIPILHTVLLAAILHYFFEAPVTKMLLNKKRTR